MIEEMSIFPYFAWSIFGIFGVSLLVGIILNIRREAPDWIWVTCFISGFLGLIMAGVGVEKEVYTTTTEIETPHLSIYTTPYSGCVVIDKEHVYHVDDLKRINALNDTSGLNFYRVDIENFYGYHIQDSILFTVDDLIGKSEN